MAPAAAEAGTPRGGSPWSCTGDAVRGEVAAAALAAAAANHDGARRWWEGSLDAGHGPCGAVAAARRLAEAQADMRRAAQAS